MFAGSLFRLGGIPPWEKNKLTGLIKEHGGELALVLSKQVTYAIASSEEAARGCTASEVRDSTIASTLRLLLCGGLVSIGGEGLLANLPPLNTITVSLMRTSLFVYASVLRQQSGMSDSLPEEEPELDDGMTALWTDTPPVVFAAFATGDYVILQQHALQKRVEDDEYSTSFLVLELHALKVAGSIPQPTQSNLYRVYSHKGTLADVDAETSERVVTYFRSLAHAWDMYEAMFDFAVDEGLSTCILSSNALGTDKAAVSAPSLLSPAIGELVDTIYTAASGHILSTLGTNARFSEAELEKARAALAEVEVALAHGETKARIASLSQAYYNSMPRKGASLLIASSDLLEKEKLLLQVVSDLVSTEEVLGAGAAADMRYSALRCDIQPLGPGTDEYKTVSELIAKNNSRNLAISIRRIYRLARNGEANAFAYNLPNRRLLFHGSNAANFVGICARGLLLPRVLEKAKDAQRTDAGMLGAGIYFASDCSTSIRYTSNAPNGSRFLLVASVALGKCKDLREVQSHLVTAPSGFDSVRGVKASAEERSDFADEEFAVYDNTQQQLRYMVEFKLNDSNAPSTLAPFVGLSQDPLTLLSALPVAAAAVPVEEKVAKVAKPPKRPEVGLIAGGTSALMVMQLPLRALSVRARIVDFVANVVLFQEYINEGSSAVEAKYVFPLDEMSSVYSFEAYINGKHVIGKCKEKEVARAEYRAAIAAGHGAYLMEKEEEEDVFTVSVGNLPPACNCIIQISYVTELASVGPAVRFCLPAQTSSSVGKRALVQQTQSETRTVGQSALNRRLICNQFAMHLPHLAIGGSGSACLDVELSVEAAHHIKSLCSPSHLLHIKRTETRATIRLAEGATLESDLELLIEAEKHNEPRIWLEQDEERHQCAMVSFFPTFAIDGSLPLTYTFIVDRSASMTGDGIAAARRAILHTLPLLPPNSTFNITGFGSFSSPLFPAAQSLTPFTLQSARSYVAAIDANYGGSDVTTALLPAMQAALFAPNILHNVFLFSDGRLSAIAPLEAAIRRSASAARVFCFATGKDIRAHPLRTLCRLTGGAYEACDFSSAANAWNAEKRIATQMKRSQCPSLREICVTWGIHNTIDGNATQAPSIILSLFSGDRQIVYAFTEATTATLRAKVLNQEVSSVVTAQETGIIKGRLLHRLAARSMIMQHDSGSYSLDPVQHMMIREVKKGELIGLSLKYGLVTQWTSFVAVEERNEGEVVLRQPPLTELVEQAAVDDMPYLGFPIPLEAIADMRESTVDSRPAVATLLNEAINFAIALEARSNEQPDLEAGVRAAASAFGNMVLQCASAAPDDKRLASFIRKAEEAANVARAAGEPIGEFDRSSASEKRLAEYYAAVCAALSAFATARAPTLPQEVDEARQDELFVMPLKAALPFKIPDVAPGSRQIVVEQRDTIFAGGAPRLCILKGSRVTLLASDTSVPLVLPLRSATTKNLSHSVLELRPVGQPRIIVAFANNSEAYEWKLAFQAAARLPPDETEVPLELEPVTKKVLIPALDYPECNFIGAIIGPRGATLKRLEAELNAQIHVRGTGSVLINKPTIDPLHVHIVAENKDLARAAEDRIRGLFDSIIDEWVRERRAAEEAKLKAEEDARLKAEMEELQRQRKEAELKRKEELRRKVEQERRALEEERKLLAEIRRIQEEEQLRTEEEERRRFEEERRKMEVDRRRFEDERRTRDEEQMREHLERRKAKETELHEAEQEKRKAAEEWVTSQREAKPQERRPTMDGKAKEKRAECDADQKERSSHMAGPMLSEKMASLRASFSTAVSAGDSLEPDAELEDLLQELPAEPEPQPAKARLKMRDRDMVREVGIAMDDAKPTDHEASYSYDAPVLCPPEIVIDFKMAAQNEIALLAAMRTPLPQVDDDDDSFGGPDPAPPPPPPTADTVGHAAPILTSRSDASHDSFAYFNAPAPAPAAAAPVPIPVPTPAPSVPATAMSASPLYGEESENTGSSRLPVQASSTYPELSAEPGGPLSVAYFLPVSPMSAPITVDRPSYQLFEEKKESEEREVEDAYRVSDEQQALMMQHLHLRNQGLDRQEPKLALSGSSSLEALKQFESDQLVDQLSNNNEFAALKQELKATGGEQSNKTVTHCGVNDDFGVQSLDRKFKDDVDFRTSSGELLDFAGFTFVAPDCAPAPMNPDGKMGKKTPSREIAAASGGEGDHSTGKLYRRGNSAGSSKFSSPPPLPPLSSNGASLSGLPPLPGNASSLLINPHDSSALLVQMQALAESHKQTESAMSGAMNMLGRFSSITYGAMKGDLSLLMEEFVLAESGNDLKKLEALQIKIAKLCSEMERTDEYHEEKSSQKLQDMRQDASALKEVSCSLQANELTAHLSTRPLLALIGMPTLAVHSALKSMPIHLTKLSEDQARALRCYLWSIHRKEDTLVMTWINALTNRIKSPLPRMEHNRIHVNFRRPDSEGDMNVELRFKLARRSALAARPPAEVCAYISLLSEEDGLLLHSSPLLDEIGLDISTLHRLLPSGWSIRAFGSLLYLLYLVCSLGRGNEHVVAQLKALCAALKDTEMRASMTSESTIDAIKSTLALATQSSISIAVSEWQDVCRAL